MKKLLEIRPMQGFGVLNFGVNQEEVRKILGEPAEKETIDVEGEIHEVEVWSYWDQGYSLYFEKDLGNVCTNFETDHEDVTLFGKKVFELSLDAVVALMQENGYNEVEVEDDDELEETIVFFHEAHMQFVFDKDKMVLVSWAVAMDDKDNILWP